MLQHYAGKSEGHCSWGTVLAARENDAAARAGSPSACCNLWELSDDLP